MNFRTAVVVKLAAAALAVAGVWGAGWAQESPISGGKASALQTLVVGYDNSNTANGTIEATATTPFEKNKFVSFDPFNDTLTTNACKLGEVKVVYTGGAAWDVEMATAFNGKLRKGGNKDSLPLQYKKSSLATTNDSVMYGVQLGIIKSSRVYAGSPVDSNSLKTSSTAKISFAKVFSTAKTNNNDTAGIGAELGRKTFANIGTGGFVKPVGTPEGTITFVVRAGLGFAGTSKILTDNAEAKYTDTIKLTLKTSD